MRQLAALFVGECQPYIPIEAARCRFYIRSRIVGFLNQFGSPATMIFMFLVLAVSFILLMRTSRYFNRPRQDEPAWSRTARPRLGGSHNHPQKMTRDSGSASEMESWEVEMHETARELKAQLDSKMSALQALIADADRAAFRLETAMKNRDIPSDSQNADDFHSFKPLKSSLSKDENIWTGLPSNQAEALRPAAASTSGDSTRYRQDEIYSLAELGLSDAAIAQKLAMPIGEVELILSLRGNR